MATKNVAVFSGCKWHPPHCDCVSLFCGHVPLPFPASSGKPAVLEKQTPARPAGWQGSVCNPCLIGADARNLRGVCQFQVSSGGFATLGREFVRNALTFVQGVKTCALNCGDVNEHIAAAVVGLDETKTFGGVEPFYDTGCHVKFSFIADRCGHITMTQPEEFCIRKGKQAFPNVSKLFHNAAMFSEGNSPRHIAFAICPSKSSAGRLAQAEYARNSTSLNHTPVQKTREL
jgi:hypothetical protein